MMTTRLYKCTLVLVLTLWAICNRAQAQLPHLPSEFSQSYKTVYFATPLLGYVGSETALTKTTDGGSHWRLVWRAGKDDGGMYFFHSGSTFWILTTHELMRTTDGGQTFTNTSSSYKGQDGGRALVGFVSFIDAQTGWTWIPEQSEIAFTHDGGVTWTGKHLRGEIGHVLDVWIFDTQRGIAGTEAGVIRTSDGGGHWSLIPGTETGFPGPLTGMPVLRELYCADDQRCLGLASTQPIRLYLTRDGGNTWTLQSLPVDDVRDKFSDAQFRTPQVAVVMGKDTKEVPEEQRWIAGPDGITTHVHIPKPNPFLLRWDGSAWSRQDITAFPDPLFSSPHPFFLDAQNGWAASLWNEIYHTTDGGVTWTAVPDYFEQVAALTPSPTPFVLPTPSP